MNKMLLKTFLFISLFSCLAFSENGEKASQRFSVSPGYLKGISSHNILSNGGIISLDYSRFKSDFGFKIMAIVGASFLSDFINDTTNNLPKDSDRSSYYGGILAGPAVMTDGKVYFAANLGILLISNYVVETRYGADNMPDREATSEQAALSFGGGGAFGLGININDGLHMELKLLVMAASSKYGLGMVNGVGPQLSIGASF